MKKSILVSAVSIMVGGAIGVTAWTTAFASPSPSAPPAVVQASTTTHASTSRVNTQNDLADGTEPSAKEADAPGGQNLQVQVGNQNGPDTATSGSEEKKAIAVSDRPGGPNVQVGSQSQNGPDSGAGA